MHDRESQVPDSEPLTDASTRAQPLYMRLYFERHMTELVRLVGYRSHATEELRPRVRELMTQYGESKVRAAIEEVLQSDNDGLLRLTDRVRQLARQILGQPPKPEHSPKKSAARPRSAPRAVDGDANAPPARTRASRSRRRTGSSPPDSSPPSEASE